MTMGPHRSWRVWMGFRGWPAGHDLGPVSQVQRPTPAERRIRRAGDDPIPESGHDRLRLDPRYAFVAQPEPLHFESGVVGNGGRASRAGGCAFHHGAILLRDAVHVQDGDVDLLQAGSLMFRGSSDTYNPFADFATTADNPLKDIAGLADGLDPGFDLSTGGIDTDLDVLGGLGGSLGTERDTNSAGWRAHIRFLEILASPKFKSYVGAITDTTELRDVTYMARTMRHGDLCSAHSDAGDGRTLCMLLYVGDGWQPGFGGRFQNIAQGKVARSTEPPGNRLILHKPAPNQIHQVEPISEAGRGWRRHCYSVWFGAFPERL